MQDSTSYDEESNELGVRALIEYIARSLVDEPEDVEVNCRRPWGGRLQ